MSVTKTTGVIQIERFITDSYPNLRPSIGSHVPCVIETFDCGSKLYTVKAEEFRKKGCDVGKCTLSFPLYGNEVKEITKCKS